MLIQQYIEWNKHTGITLGLNILNIEGFKILNYSNQKKHKS